MNTSESSLETNSELTENRKVESVSRPGLMVKLAALQFIGTVLFCLVLYVCTDAYFAISALLGGSIAALTSLYMAGRLFAMRSKSEPPEMLVRFYSSVILKVLFTLSMMAICIFVIKVSIVPFIIAYLLVAVAINLAFLLVPTNDVIIRVDREKAGREKI